MRAVFAVFVAATTFVFGLAAGYFFVVRLLPDTSFMPDHPLYRTFGVVKPKVVGFLPYFLMSKATHDYHPYLTDLTYFGLALQPDGSVQKLVNPHEQEPGYTALTGGKWTTFAAPYADAGVGTSLLVHTGDEDTIATLVANPASSAATLVSSVLPAMKTYNFRDLNLDIESFRTASDSARANFTTFLATVTSAMHTAGYTVTVELSPSAFTKSYLTDPVAVGRYADYALVMGYDYHYTGSYVTGPIAPVHGVPSVRENDVATTIAAATAAIPPEKIILGIPLYGYQWEALTATPAAGVIPGSGVAASAARVASLSATCTTCTVTRDPIADERIIIKPDPTTGSIYQFFVPDQAALTSKLSLATEYHLAGIALWALGYEDESLLSPLSAYRASARLIPSFTFPTTVTNVMSHIR